MISPVYRALPLIQVDDLRFFVLDEADRMVEKGHFKELQSIIDTLPKQGGSSPAESDPPEEDGDDDTVPEAPVAKHAAQRQTFVFSATLMVPPSLKKKLKGAGKVPMRREQGQVAALIERAGAWKWQKSTPCRSQKANSHFLWTHTVRVLGSYSAWQLGKWEFGASD